MQGAMLFTPKNNPANLCGGELHTVDDDTCDGHGSHRGSPRHENGGEALKILWSGFASCRLICLLNRKVKKFKSALHE